MVGLIKYTLLSILLGLLSINMVLNGVNIILSLMVPSSSYIMSKITQQKYREIRNK